MRAPVITFVARTVVGSTLLRRPWPIFVALCWCVASAAAAQSALTGIVHDPSYRIAVGATVTVYDTSATQEWQTHVSPIGYYEIELPPGEYRVVATLDMLSFEGTVKVLPNEKAAFDIVLQLAKRQELVNVESTLSTGADAFGPSGATSATFTNEQINSMQLLNGHALQSLQSLVPGVTYTDSNGSQAQFTAIGQRRFANRLTVDGVSADLAVDISNLGITEAETGTLPAVSTLGSTLTFVPWSAVEEVQIKTTDTAPSEARATGAQTMIITRAGGDRFAGDAFTDIRPQGLGASDWFANSLGSSFTTGHKEPASSLNSGATAGGPVVPQRVFYFAAFEHQRVTRPVDATVLVPSREAREKAADNVKPLLNLFPIPNGPEATGQLAGLAQLSSNYPAESSLSTFSLRVDANLSSAHRLFGRANFGRSRGDWVDAAQVPSTLYDNDELTRTKTGTLGLTSAFSSSLTNEARFSVSMNGGWVAAAESPYVNGNEFPRQLFLPADSSQGLITSGESPWIYLSVPGFGANISSGGWMGNTLDQVQFADTLSLSRGRHEFRAGVDGRWLTSATNPAPEFYSYRFAPLNTFFNGRATLTIQKNIPVRVRFTRIALFAEDTVRMSKNFSLGYGVRYNVEPAPSNLTDTPPVIFDATALPEMQVLPTGTPLWKTSWGNVAPRLAATYQFGTGTAHETTVRGLWNLGFDDLTAASANIFGSYFPYVSRRVALVSEFPVPASVSDTPDPAKYSITDRNIYYASLGTVRTPRTYSWHVGVDQALGGSQRLSVAYVGAAGRDASYWFASNVSSLPAVLRVTAFSNDGQSDYHAMLAEYAWRLSHGVQAKVSYTWSHAIDVDSGEISVLVNESAPRPALLAPAVNRGSADFDRRHVLQAGTTYQIPLLAGPKLLRTLGADWQVDVGLTLRSGAPFSVTAARDFGDGPFNYRVDPVAGVPVWIDDPSAPGGQSLNPKAFVIPTEPRQGRLGRNTLRASPLRQVNLTLSREIRLGDRMTARLRLDAFNVFNIPNFGVPFADAQMPPEQFGRAYQSYANALGTGTLTGGGLVPVQQVGGPRSLQIGIRLAF